MRRKTVSAPTSEELLAEWRMRLIEEHSEPSGGCLGDRVARAERQAWRASRLRWIEYVLIERMWAEPVGEGGAR